MDNLFSVGSLFDEAINPIIGVPLAHHSRRMFEKVREVVDAGLAEQAKFRDRMRLAGDMVCDGVARRSTRWDSVPETANPPKQATTFKWLVCCASLFDRATGQHKNGGLTDDLFGDGSRAMDIAKVLFNPNLNSFEPFADWMDVAWATAGIGHLRSLCDQSQFDFVLPKLINAVPLAYSPCPRPMDYARLVQAGEKIGIRIADPLLLHTLMVDVQAPHGGSLVMQHNKTTIRYAVDCTVGPGIDINKLGQKILAEPDQSQALALVRAVNHVHSEAARRDPNRVKFPDIDAQHAVWTHFLHQNFPGEVALITPAAYVGPRPSTLLPDPL